VEIEGDRVKYKLVTGQGPEEGWVSINLKVKDGKELPLLTKIPRPARWPTSSPSAVEKKTKDKAKGDDKSKASDSKDTAADGKDQEPEKPTEPAVGVLACMACHISADARVDRLKHVLNSILHQDLHQVNADLVVSISWSTKTPELKKKVEAVLTEFCDGKSRQSNLPQFSRIITHQTQRHSQFQHLRAAVNAAEEELRRFWRDPDAEENQELSPSSVGNRPSGMKGGLDSGRDRTVWVMFGDDDDIWQKRRVAEYVSAIRRHPTLDGVGVFATCARAMPGFTKSMKDEDMPTSEEEVEKFLKSSLCVRLNNEKACRDWYRRLKNVTAVESPVLEIGDELALEYFDLCPRLRLVHEFYCTTTQELLRHRYCDLRFLEFLITYSRFGRETGLEVTFFEPRSWMYFYSCSGSDDKLLEKSIEAQDENATSIGMKGHMATEVIVEEREVLLAEKVIDRFQLYDESLSKIRLARYWAMFRNVMELYLVRCHTRTLDQRSFDGFVYMAVCGSFFKFADKVNHMSTTRANRAWDMMLQTGQEFSKGMAKRLKISILWHKPEKLIEPVFEEEAQPATKFQYTPGYYNNYGHYPSAGGHYPGPWSAPPWSKQSSKGGGKGAYGMNSASNHWSSPYSSQKQGPYNSIYGGAKPPVGYKSPGYKSMYK